MPSHTSMLRVRFASTKPILVCAVAGSDANSIKSDAVTKTFVRIFIWRNVELMGFAFLDC